MMVETRKTVEKTMETIDGLVDGVTDSVVGLTGTLVPQTKKVTESWVGFIRNKRSAFRGLVLDTIFQATELAREGEVKDGETKDEAPAAEKAPAEEATA